MYTFLLSKIEVGSHLYVDLTESLHFHGETGFVSVLVVTAVSLFLLAGTSDLQKVPGNLQNLVEVVFELVKSIAFTQLGPSYYAQFLPFTATVFLFVLGSNWAGALIPWKLLELSEGELSAPIVIGRDHLDCGSVASPNRETEAMKDGSDAIADWPILNALLNTASGASWVSYHHGGGVGMGYSLHSGQVLVADGSKEMDSRIEAVLSNDPKMGLFRHADAGYEEAIDNSKKWGIKIPMLEK